MHLVLFEKHYTAVFILEIINNKILNAALEVNSKIRNGKSFKMFKSFDRWRHDLKLSLRINKTWRIYLPAIFFYYYFYSGYLLVVYVCISETGEK